MKFVSLLPEVPLPFETNCMKCCDRPKIDYDNELVKKFSSPSRIAPEGIIGLIARTENNVLILETYAADNIIPVVSVLDFKGKRLGRMAFLTNACGGDPGYYGRQYFRIDKDITLTSIDTSYYFTLDSLTHDIVDTTKIDIVNRKFVINSKGEIVEHKAL